MSRYRYGFNGKENDNEVKGEGNQQDYGFRIYDPRVGRFLSVDPLTKDYPWYTPYQFAGNKPIWAVDLDGMEEWTSNDGGAQQGPWKMEYMAAQGYEPAGSNFINDFSPGTTPVTSLENLKIKEPFERTLTIPVGLIGTSYELGEGRTMKLEGIYAEPLQGGIGGAEGASGLIPLYGSGRNAINDFQNGRYVSGTFNTAMAVSDAFLVKSIAQGLAKGGLKLAGSNSWNATRRFYLNKGFARRGEPLHHWLIHRNGPIGKSVPDIVKNQMWNLKSFATQAEHMVYGHGQNYLGREGAGFLGRMWGGTPTWPKLAVGSYGGRGLKALYDDISVNYDEE